MDAKKILFISQEISPYVAENPRSLLARALPQAFASNGYEARTFMPRYGLINERRNQLHEVIRLSGLNIPIDDTDHQLIIKVATMLPSRTQVYFIDNDDYFHRRSPKGLETEIHPQDNDERLIFYTRGVIETIKKLRWPPAIIHCQGWLASLIPLYIKKLYNDDPSLASAKIVVSLLDDGFDGLLDERFIAKLKADGVKDQWMRALKEASKTEIDYRALMRSALHYADAVVQASAEADPEMVERAQSLKKPFVTATAEPTPEALKVYADLYQQLL